MLISELEKRQIVQAKNSQETVTIKQKLQLTMPILTSVCVYM